MPKTAVGLFEGSSAADLVVHDLAAACFPRNEIRVLQEPVGMEVADVTSIPHTDFEVSLGRELKAMGASEVEANNYVLGVRRGGVLVFATGSSDQVDDAARTMNRHGAMQVEELVGREPAQVRTASAGGSLPLSHDSSAPTPEDRSTQTGRVRQSGDGVRMFVW